MHERRDLFKLILGSVRDCAIECSLRDDQAFGKWFVKLYSENPQGLFISDGTHDGKVDLFYQDNKDGAKQYIVLNTKFTTRYNAPAPAQFYDEVTRFGHAFSNKSNRPGYLSYVRKDLKVRYSRLFRAYDSGEARLIFVTNHRCNTAQFLAIKNIGVELIHLEELIQYVLDDLEGAMPRTQPLTLSGISQILTSEPRDTTVPIHVVFARLDDFIDYMETDPLKLLFARNVRLSLGNTPVNQDILKTFTRSPEEFAYSNNGITMLGERIDPDLANRELRIVNPRIVNGAQTLHAISGCQSPSKKARIMVRIIEVEPPRPDDISRDAELRKALIGKIAVRTNFQNPIKKWDLVSNDDFQHDIARYFRKKSYFYERRKNEWLFRKGDLMPVGVRRGPYLRSLMQYIASYLWHKQGLGPAAAKGQLKELFEDPQYTIIRSTPVAIVHQIYLISQILRNTVKIMAPNHRTTENLRRAGDLTLFALHVKALKAHNIPWGAESFTHFLEAQLDGPGKEWFTLTKGLNLHIWSQYRIAATAHRRSRGKDLSLANYFSSESHLDRLLGKRTPGKVGKALKRLLRHM